MSITSTVSVQSPTPKDATGAWDPVEWHEAAGARIAVARAGSGQPLVCLHATGHGARDFRGLADRVGDAFEVIAVDWPAHGRSPRDTAPASAWRYATVLEDLLPRLVDAPPIVLGCSIGGAAALQLAATRPDLVRALVLCDPGGLVAMNAFTRMAIRAMSAFFAAGARGAKWFPRAFAMYYRLVLPSTPARAWRERIVSAAPTNAAVLAEAWASFADARSDLRPVAASVACPVLFAWAQSDLVLPWRGSRAGTALIPDHRVEFFRGGHAAFMEDPERFAASLRAFAAEL